MPLNETVDNLCVYDPEFDYIAERFVSEMGGNSTSHEVKSLSDLKTAFSSYNGVRFFEVCLHGTAGMIWFADKIVMSGSHINTLCANSMFLRKDARILFDNCCIGEGTKGDDFMDSIGAGLLKGKGGTVGATTVKNLSHPWLSWTGIYMRPLSFGRLKVKRYDDSGKLIASRTVDRHGFQR